MNRRNMLKQMGLALAASGLAVPAWILDPPKGRSMVTVPPRTLGNWIEVDNQWFLPHDSDCAHWVDVKATAVVVNPSSLKIEVAHDIRGPWVEWNPNDMADAPRYFRAVGTP